MKKKNKAINSPKIDRWISDKSSRCDICGRITNLVVDGVFICCDDCEEELMNK